MLSSLRRLSSAFLAPWSLAAGAARRPPHSFMPLLVDSASGAAAAAPPPQSLSSLLMDSLLRMAVPKRRVTRRTVRIRQAGYQKARGPQHKSHMYMCPVCERFRLPHRVCGREDCQTYFKRALPQWMEHSPCPRARHQRNAAFSLTHHEACLIAISPTQTDGISFADAAWNKSRGISGWLRRASMCCCAPLYCLSCQAVVIFYVLRIANNVFLVSSDTPLTLRISVSHQFEATCSCYRTASSDRTGPSL